jgi:hypothetical protein
MNNFDRDALRETVADKVGFNSENLGLLGFSPTEYCEDLIRRAVSGRISPSPLNKMFNEIEDQVENRLAFKYEYE